MTTKPDKTYITRILQQMRTELQVSHMKMDELEALRYFEDRIQLSDEDRRSGISVRVGLTAELVENVKAALTTNVPRIKVTTYATSDKAKANTTKRERFWNRMVLWVNEQFPTFSEAADGVIGLGLGICKASFNQWDGDFTRIPKESSKAYLSRMKTLKQQEGPPFSIIDIHPMTFYYRRGAKNQISECVEHAYKSRYEVYEQYGLTDQMTLALPKTPRVKGARVATANNANNLNIAGLQGTAGQPDTFIRSLPSGMDTSTLVLVTEYWSRHWYVVLVNGQEVYSEENPSVAYFIATGRTSSSKDPDKVAISVAEPLRHAEPGINRALSRMFEALELIVKKRLTVEYPEGSTDGTVIDENGNITTRTYQFSPDKADSLPAGARIQDPFGGAENAYEALPAIQFLMQIAAQHGVNPIFKGASPGAAGSGYRDNSLYLMAKSQFQYLIDSFANMLTALFNWLEWCLLTHIKQEIWLDDLSLKPEDVDPALFPVRLSVEIDPSLPQNAIAEGSFMDRMHSEGYITKRRVREEGLGIEAPEEEEFMVDLETAKDQMRPLVISDAIQTVLGRDPNQVAQTGPGLVGPNGAPISSTNMGPRPAVGNATGGPGRAAGESMGGTATGGQPHAPATPAGSTIPVPPMGGRP